MKKSSTITELVEFCLSFLVTMEQDFQTDVIYTDLSKAFDRIPHDIILLKLKRLGFCPVFVSWITSYLTGRSYKVLFTGVISNSYSANSGVPQGSHLGLLLFILSINDVISFINNSSITIYADDMEIYKKITDVI